MKTKLCRVSRVLSIIFVAVASAAAASHQRATFVITSTNNPDGNNLVVFKLNETTPALTLVNMLPTGGAGGASGNAGAVQFQNFFGAVVNYGSNTVSQLVRDDNSLKVARTIELAPGCVQPVSVSLTFTQAFIVGSNCAESHAWPWGRVDGHTVSLSDASAAQIVAGQTWAAVTLKSGSVLQLPLTDGGALHGTSATVTLPSDANNTPLGAAFWDDVLGFNPAHSSHSFALVDRQAHVFPVLGPQPPYPTNAPCWLAKGPGNVWYSGNSPGQAVSIFFSDGRGGRFYKSVSLPGVPTDVTVSSDNKWLAVIYTAADGSGGRIAVFAIDAYGGLSLAATSDPVGVTSFSGVAISQ